MSLDAMEQMMIQIWLGQLLASLKEGKVDHVISELEIALARTKHRTSQEGMELAVAVMPLVRNHQYAASKPGAAWLVHL
jgi:hypothetical protein